MRQSVHHRALERSERLIHRLVLLFFLGGWFRLAKATVLPFC